MCPNVPSSSQNRGLKTEEQLAEKPVSMKKGHVKVVLCCSGPSQQPVTEIIILFLSYGSKSILSAVASAGKLTLFPMKVSCL